MDSNRVAIATGAASGIGRAVCNQLALDGYTVVAADTDESGANDTIDRLPGRASNSFALPIDVTSPASVSAAVAEVVSRLHRIDALVCSAGVAGRNAPLSELSLEEWGVVLATNLTGVFLMCQQVIPYMTRNGWGRIVNISSIAGKEGNPNAAAYSASKAGVIGLSKGLAKELATTGVLVNCVTPAVIETPMLAQVSEAHIKYMISKIPMGRVGRPEEVAALVGWLCSAACSFSTGAVFDISGGRATY
jgi:NAD(P)-dependent dehydrogenase (short-subunit alcohol dehydrogenase family)